MSVKTLSHLTRLACAAAALSVAACQDDNPTFRPPGAALDAGRPDTDAPPRADAAATCTPEAACDDGDPCTTGDRCDARGVCEGTAQACDDGDPCTQDACDLTTGACTHAPGPRGESEGTPGSDACIDGRDQDCDGRADADDPDCRTCETGADCPPGGLCAAVSCQAGRCVETPAADATPCDDQDLCTPRDICVAGACVGQDRVACDASADDACNRAACNPRTGACEPDPKADGTACDDGDLCTTQDDCRGGQCVGAPVGCGALDTPCRVGVCDAATGACRAVSRSDGTPCGGDLCQSAGVCAAGTCSGAAVDCGALDGDCRVGVCDPATGACGVEPLPDGVVCDDGQACTTDDACTAGVCAGRARDCEGLGGACSASRCDPESGACVVEAAPNGQPCDDGVACTEGDRCDSGACLGSALNCAGAADGRGCFVGRCDPAVGACEAAPAPAGKPCNDGDRCTVTDVCDGVEGACAGRARACDDGDACTVDDCDPASGGCTHVRQLRDAPEGAPGDAACSNGTDDDCDGLVDAADPDCRGCAVDADCAAAADPCRAYTCAAGRCVSDAAAREGQVCNDGNGCTSSDRCRAGVCSGGGVDCSALDGPCTRGLCDPARGRCVPEVLGDGAVCDDDNACTTEDQCAAGLCAGAARDCAALDGECVVGRCDLATGACAASPRADGAPCTDGDACTGRDVCAGGVCAGRPEACEAPQNPCEAALCDPSTGACAVAAVPDGSACDDGDPCTVESVCTLGACVGRPRDCTALDGACVVGACDRATGACRAQPRADGLACDDGRPCSEGDACSGGVCGGAERDCSALDDACVAGVCDQATGRCVTAPVLDGVRCDDGDACTVNDRCGDGRCGGATVACGALDTACTLGVCDPATGACTARSRNEGGACDDGQACTQGDTCAEGRCAGDGLDCRGLDGPCTVGQCDAAGDCVAVPIADGAPCDAADLCATGASCQAGACVPVPRDCDDLTLGCDVGACDPRTGACIASDAPNGTACDDGDPCTVNDQCNGGACSASPRDCSALNGPCTVGVCDAATGGCVAVPRANGVACDDGNPCTLNDACAAGTCGGAARDCSGTPGQTECRVGVCDRGTGACVLANAANGAACSDGAFCTTGDACSDGVCRGGARDCNPPGEPCRRGVCNEGADRCDVENLAEFTPCDDGQFCTTNDRCRSGVCRSFTARSCPDANSGCRQGVCDEQANACGFVNARDGQACLDGNICTLGDSCSSGECDPGRNWCN